MPPRRKRKRKFSSAFALADDDLAELLSAGSSPDIDVVDNHIYFYTAVTQRSACELVQHLRKLNIRMQNQGVQFGTDPRIYLHINSEGGEVFAALAAVDAIRNSVVPVTTIVEGCAASAATLMSVVGDERRIQRHAHMLIHQLSSDVWGKMAEIED